jgi:ribosomal protein L29
MLMSRTKLLELSSEQLEFALHDACERSLRAKMDAVSERKNAMSAKQSRREIARVLTEMRRRELSTAAQL